MIVDWMPRLDTIKDTFYRSAELFFRSHANDILEGNFWNLIGSLRFSGGKVRFRLTCDFDGTGDISGLSSEFRNLIRDSVIGRLKDTLA
jgi:hypothetical protein